MITIAPALPAPPAQADAGHDECGFPGSVEAEGMCREIPVATISETCRNGHIGLLRACAGHANEITGWNGEFIGDIDSPGVLTCPRCEDDGNRAVRLNVALTWDDVRVEIVQ